MVIVLIFFLSTANLNAQDKRVLVIGIDGLMPEAIGTEYIPNINSLAMGEHGFFTYGYTEDLTFSGPSWSAVLNGVHYDRHGITTNSYDGHDFTDHPNFLKRLKNHNQNLNTAAFVVWPSLKNNFMTPNGDWTGVDKLEFRTLLEDGGQWVTERAAEHLGKDDPAAVFYYQSDVDAAGHEYGFSIDIEGYRNQLIETDGRIGKVLDALNNRPGVVRGEEDWLIILVGDHGGVGKGHGGNLYRQRLIPVILYGNAVSESGLAGSSGEMILANPASEFLIRPRNVDVSKTALVFMGVTEEYLIDLDGNNMLQLPKRTPAEFRVNLIFNGDGEYDRGFKDRSLDQVISGWRDQEHTGRRDGYHSMTLIKAPEDLVILDKEGNSVDEHFQNLFTGGRKGVHSSMSQLIDLTNKQSEIDNRSVNFHLSGFLGSEAGIADRMMLKAIFMDKNYDIIDTVIIEQMQNDSNSEQTILKYSEQEGFIFPGTRYVRIELHAIAESEKEVGIQAVATGLKFNILKMGE